jgi:hypothetical protein
MASALRSSTTRSDTFSELAGAVVLTCLATRYISGSRPPSTP